MDFGALVVDLVTTLGASRAAGRVALEVMQSDPLICHADSVRLEQIVGNLLNNAIKATAAAGQVVVRISAEDGFARFLLWTTAAVSRLNSCRTRSAASDRPMLRKASKMA